MSGHINPLITPFYADQVGSSLCSGKLKAARLQKQNNEITAEQLIQIQRQETRLHVEQQILAGLTAITDGEYSQAWWHFYFLDGLYGVEDTVVPNPSK